MEMRAWEGKSRQHSLPSPLSCGSELPLLNILLMPEHICLKKKKKNTLLSTSNIFLSGNMSPLRQAPSSANLRSVLLNPLIFLLHFLSKYQGLHSTYFLEMTVRNNGSKNKIICCCWNVCATEVFFISG